MPWSQLDPISGAGYETLYQGSGFSARLLFDCHREARKLEVQFTAAEQLSDAVLEHLKPFGSPVVVSPGQLVIIDREGYFRLYLIPGRLQALLRKAAPLSVLGELMGQIERAMRKERCDGCPQLCPAGALSYAGDTLVIDGRCTRCLDCVRHHASPMLTPPAAPPPGTDV
jgi:ferredoxin